LDKFLWIGFVIMVYGLYKMAEVGAMMDGLWYIVAGAIVLALFLILIVKEYEVIK